MSFMPSVANAKIIRTSLGWEDHGIMTCTLTLEGDGWGTEYGGYALDTWDSKAEKRVGTANGFNAIINLMKALDVDEWGKLKGQYIRCKFDKDDRVVAVGHLIKDKWFSFANFFSDVVKET